MLKIAFDIGGVLSKYPHIFRELCLILSKSVEIYIITDMHDHEEIIKLLNQNGFDFISSDHVFSSDYATYGEGCKAVLLKELKIDIFIDDFVGYLNWDSQLGKAPIRLLVCPDMFQPYWHQDWEVSQNVDFGRRKAPSELI